MDQVHGEAAMSVTKKFVAVAAVAMLLTAAAGCDRTVTRIEQVQTPESCFQCHSDQNTELVALERQWTNSTHASGNAVARATSGSCNACHASEGFIQRAAGESVTGAENPTIIHCFTCHAPHTNGDLSLRWMEMAETENGETGDLGGGNTCAACHHSRRDVETYVDDDTELSEHWGPHHSPQTDMLLGTNGYEFGTYTYESTMHATATDDGCVDCHMFVTGDPWIGGHSFAMHAVVDGDTSLNTGACEDCHGEADTFDEVTSLAVQDSVETLLGNLQALLITAGMLDSTSHEPPDDVVVTTADSVGALWNYLFVEEDQSHGVHNPEYAIGLLRSAIIFMGGTPRMQDPALVERSVALDTQRR
jgi:nitrate/TMAO reductase-like tetraheme cytochrome c subunit